LSYFFAALIYIHPFIQLLYTGIYSLRVAKDDSVSKYHKIEMDIILLVRSRRSPTAFKLIDLPSLSHRQALLLGSAAYATEAIAKKVIRFL
jgi:hypothetical protein